VESEDEKGNKSFTVMKLPNASKASSLYQPVLGVLEETEDTVVMYR